MTTTPRLAITQLVSAQALPESNVNEAVRWLEQGAGSFSFKSATTTAEPGSPTDGDLYLVPGSPTGTHWSGQGGKIAQYVNTAWEFKTPLKGMIGYVVDTDSFIGYSNASTWINLSSTAVPSIQAVTSAATVTPTFSNDMVKVTAQAAGLTLANPTGTAIPGWGLVIRIKDNGTARAITYGTQYRALGVTLPTTTVISKTLYLALIYNADDTKWDVVAVAQEA